MATYRSTVRETVTRTRELEADSLQDAREQAEMTTHRRHRRRSTSSPFSIRRQPGERSKR